MIKVYNNQEEIASKIVKFQKFSLILRNTLYFNTNVQ